MERLKAQCFDTRQLSETEGMTFSVFEQHRDWEYIHGKKVNIMGNNIIESATRESFDGRVNELAREHAALEPDDPRRRQIEEEVSRIRLISKSVLSH